MSDYCEKYSGLIEDLMEGELDGQTAEQVDLHVFDCPQCRQQYETLSREKELYAHYLFDAEPPEDLWNNFQKRLIPESEKTSANTEIPTALPWQRKNAFAFLRLSPALATAALLLLLGAVFVWLIISPFKKGGNKYVAETRMDESPSRYGNTNQPATTKPPEKITVESDMAAKNIEPIGKNQSFKTRRNFSAAGKSFVAESVKIKQKSVASGAKKNRSHKIQPNESEMAALKTKNLETEIAGQIEKVQLLLRSFRNARSFGSVENFDVEYERRQARKLLEKNARLRRDAEDYGISYAEELLSRVEPYLLDIANLEANPAPHKVLDIKERVSNQNIIASLQVYCCAEAQ